MSKIQSSDEIDLVDIFIVIWNRKFSIIIFVILSLVAMYLFKSLNKVPNTIIVSTQIKPITVYEEAKYKIYNLYMETIRSDFEGSTEINKEIIQIGEEVKIIDKVDIDLEINKINKRFLLNLFIERLNQKITLVEALKKFKYLKKGDFADAKDYENAVMDIASSINLQNADPVNLDKKNNIITIQFETTNTDNWEDFLKFLEEDINIEIQKKLTEMIDNYINYVKKIKKFELEDIETKLAFAVNDEERINLKKKKDILIQDKYIERIQNIFDGSPISNTSEFYAAHIYYDSTSYDVKDNSTTMKMSYPLAGVFATLIAIFFVLIANAIQNRK